MFNFPSTKDVLASLPEPSKSEYKYRTIKLKPGTNVISTKIANDKKNPFTIYFSATQRVTYAKIVKGRMVKDKVIVKAPSLSELKLGYYDSNMKHIDFTEGTNAFTTDGTCIAISFFGDHATTPPEDGAKELIYTDNEVYVTYLDSITELSVGVGGGDYTSLGDAITVAAPGATIKLAKGTYDKPISIDKSLTIIGSDGATIAEKVAITKPATDNDDNDNDVVPSVNVTIKNVLFTGNGIISADSSDSTHTSLNMEDCIFNLEPTESDVPGIDMTGDGKAFLDIKNCEFNDSGNKVYNMINITAKLMNGSNISGNKFRIGCCSHNHISLYGIEDDASIRIDKNYANKSANMVRIGFKGDPIAKVYLDGNKYDTTELGEYAGLLLVQPYLNETTGMSNVQIFISNTVHNDTEQLAYLYAGTKDTQWTDENKPEIFIDGVKYDLTGKLNVTEESDEPAQDDTTTENS